MNEKSTHAVLVNPGPLSWVRDRDQVLVLEEDGRQQHVLRGIEAVVWDWLMLAYPYPKILRLLTVLLALPAGETEQRLRAILQKWQAAGILEIEAG